MPPPEAADEGFVVLIILSPQLAGLAGVLGLVGHGILE